MKELIAVANEEIRKPESQTTELLKRVFIGLIIASFFFAILRYIAAQYRLNWEQVIIANTEDERLRKFYVAFKAAGNNTNDRTALVTSLVSIQASSANNDNAKEIEIDKAHLELIKEVLNAITKKI